MVINKKIKRTMLENKSQYIGSIFLIILSCLLFIMLNMLSDNIINFKSAFEKNYLQEDASFVTYTKLQNIKDLESRFNTKIEEGSNFDYQISKDKTIRIFRENEKVNIPAIIEGKNLVDSTILIDPAFSKANNLKIGDTISIYDKSFKISGFMSLPNYIYILKSENDILNNANSFGIAVISKNDFNKLSRGNIFYSIRFNSNNISLEKQKELFINYLKDKKIFIRQWNDISENQRVTLVNAKLDGISKMSSTMPITILLLTCILSGIVIWRMLNRESMIIGTLYAQGYTVKEIRNHYLRYPLVIALTGGIIGTILGALLLKPMLNFMLEYFNIPVSVIKFNPNYVLVSLLLPIAFLIASGYIVLNKVLKYSPVELMRGTRESSKVNFIEKHLNLNKFKFSTKFKIRQQLRSLSRLIFLLFGVIISTMLLLLGFTAKSSMDYLLKDNLKSTYKFKYEYVYNSLHQEEPPVGTEQFSAAQFTLKSNSKMSFDICAILPNANLIEFKDTAGAKINTDKVVITRPLADKLKVTPGYIIQIVNKLDGKEYSVTINSIAETYVGEYIFMPLAQFNSMLGLPSKSYVGFWSNTKFNIPDKELYSFNTVEDSVKAFNNLTQPLQATIGIISFMSFVIGLIVIYVVTSLIIEENKGNISLMKVLGYRRKEISSLILNSSLVIVAIGYLIGIPFTLLSMQAMFKSITQNMKLTMPIRIDYSYALIGFIVIYLTYELSKFFSKKKINRITMSDALKLGIE